MNKVQTVDLDTLELRYKNDSDIQVPIIKKSMIKSTCAEFISTKFRSLNFNIFKGLGITDISFNFNISINAEKELDAFDSFITTKGINIFDSNLESKVIKCRELISFASTLSFEELECGDINIKLTRVKGSEEDTEKSPTNIILDRNKFKLRIDNIEKGIIIQ